jgi:hypothetical protein
MTRTRPKLSLPSFKPLDGGFPAAAPLGFALAAALVGHGLLLAPSPWRRNPTKAQVLTAVDTTPELLRFSRRMPQEVAATTIPLPPATTLPPPPPDLLGPLPNKDAKDAGPTKTPDATTAKSGAKQSEAKTLRIHPSPRPKPTKSSSPGAHGGEASLAKAREAGNKAHPLPGQAAKGLGTKNATKGPKGAPASGPTGEGAETTPLALAPTPLRLSPSPPAEALQRWRDLRATAEGAPPAPGSSGPASEPLKASEATPYLRLWDQAAPAPFAAGTDRDLSEGVQARRLPLAAARALGLDPGQQQWLKSAGQSLLVWIDGPNLWLLKGPISPEKPGR